MHQRTVFDRTPDAHYLSQNKDTFYDVPDSFYSAKELSALINKLGDEYRAPLQMHIAGYKYKEIADDLGPEPRNRKKPHILCQAKTDACAFKGSHRLMISVSSFAGV